MIPEPPTSVYLLEELKIARTEIARLRKAQSDTLRVRI
jgi:hypothetical protein